MKALLKITKSLTIGDIEAVGEGLLIWIFDSSFSCCSNQGELAPLKFSRRSCGCNSSVTSGGSAASGSGSGTKSSFDDIESSHANIANCILIVVKGMCTFNVPSYACSTNVY